MVFRVFRLCGFVAIYNVDEGKLYYKWRNQKIKPIINLFDSFLCKAKPYEPIPR